jgi:hypothetical protein
MAYKHTNSKGTEYILHSRATGKGNGRIFFFAKEEKEGAMDALPEGYEIKESEKTGLPILKKIVQEENK